MKILGIKCNCGCGGFVRQYSFINRQGHENKAIDSYIKRGHDTQVITAEQYEKNEGCLKDAPIPDNQISMF